MATRTTVQAQARTQAAPRPGQKPTRRPGRNRHRLTVPSAVLPEHRRPARNLRLALVSEY